MLSGMYHAMAKRIAHKSFRRINDKYFDALLVDCEPDSHNASGAPTRLVASGTTRKG